MKVLEESWFGNIDPTEYDASAGEEYAELRDLIRRNEEKLQAIMTDEQKEWFSRYKDCVEEFQNMAECLLFQHSFRLGARMMLEVMEERMYSNVKAPIGQLWPMGVSWCAVISKQDDRIKLRCYLCASFCFGNIIPITESNRSTLFTMINANFSRTRVNP